MAPTKCVPQTTPLQVSVGPSSHWLVPAQCSGTIKSPSSGGLALTSSRDLPLTSHNNSPSMLCLLKTLMPHQTIVRQTLNNVLRSILLSLKTGQTEEQCSLHPPKCIVNSCRMRIQVFLKIRSHHSKTLKQWIYRTNVKEKQLLFLKCTYRKVTKIPLY